MSYSIHIGEHNVPCVVGLEWKNERDKKGECCIYSIDGKQVQFGFPTDEADAPSLIGQNSLALWCAETFSTGITVSSLEIDGNVKYWMCAVSEGVILTETDCIYDNVVDLEDAVLDAMDVVARDSIYQLCHASISISGSELVFHDLTAESFSEDAVIGSHGMSGKMKGMIAGFLFVVLAAGGAGYYFYDLHQQELAAEQARAAAIIAQQMIIDKQDNKLQHQNPLLAISVVKEIKSLPGYLVGWKIDKAAWDALTSELTVNYTRIDGTIDLFNKAVSKYADSVDLALADTKHISFIKALPLKGYVEGNLMAFADIRDDLVSLLQHMENRGVQMTNTMGFASAVTPSLTWEMHTKKPMLVLNSLNGYGFVLSKIEWKASGEWVLNGGFYAK